MKKKLEDEAFRLSPRARARLAKRLIASLDEREDPDVLKAWKDEARSRAKEIASGNAKVISAAKVFKKARTMLR
ncbi:MAG: addiction module protein [Candidatus Binataceae bacterium]